MPLTIDLAPETEKRLTEEAGKHGLPATEYARRLIEQQLPANVERKKPTQKVLRAWGKYAHILPSSDEFAAQKQEEIDHEDRRR